MILLSNGGTNIQRAQAPSDTILVGTVDGVALLARTDAAGPSSTVLCKACS